MPSRRSRITATEEREERKKRQEKFRKRTRSLFNKTRLLAKDTDAWVALVVRDRAGRVQSFRSSGSLYWPPSIQDLMVSRHFLSSIVSANPGRKTTHPSGTHEFLEKHAISGCWKEVAEDENDTGMADGDAESVDEDVPAISVIPVEKEAAPDSTISVDQCHVGEDVEDGADAPWDIPDETVAEKAAVDPLGESDNTPLLQVKELDGTLVDAGQLHNAAIDAARESGNPRVDSPRKDAALDSSMPDDTIFEFGAPGNTTVDASEESNNTTTDMAADSHNTTARKLGDTGNVPDAPGESMAVDIPGTAEPDLTTSEYDMMDLDIPGAKSRAQPDVREGDSIEAANTLYTMSQYHNPPSSGGLGSWQVVNWPKVDPKELLQSWNWVFQNRYHQ